MSVSWALFESSRHWTRVMRSLLIASMVLLAGCSIHPKQVREAAHVVQLSQSYENRCGQHSPCDYPSPMMTAADALESAASEPKHRVGLLEDAEQALVLRIHLIRAAKHSIDLQTFIFSDDDSGKLVLQELLAAAERGVKVRVLADQLFSIASAERLAQLARTHRQFNFRVYNPTFGEANTSALEFAAGIVCCFKRFNQRMHNKLLLIDGRIGINGGRNVDDRYYDWSAQFNYRDRDILVMGPASRQMKESFDIYWRHPQTVAMTALKDVSLEIIQQGVSAPKFEVGRYREPDRVARLSAMADDSWLIQKRHADTLFAVHAVEYFSDLPNKPFERHPQYDRDLTARLSGLIGEAREKITLQTPYLVFSKPAQKQFRDLLRAHPDLKIEVSTNSLAATDAFYVYAISYKFRRRNLTHLKMQIHEYRPWPKTELRAPEPPMAWSSGSRGSERVRLRNRDPAPVRANGTRRGMHAKSLVVDERVAMVGTHNFDPRSVDFNTESGVVVWDGEFARALREAIQADMAPDQAWVIARSQQRGWLDRINNSVTKFSEKLPLFDFWPFRYATSYEMKPGCSPLSPDAPGFYDCYQAVGDFPEVDATFKHIYTRMVTAFGAGLSPIL